MRVFVAGGTGFVGPHLIREFLAEGYEVKALVRHPDRIARLPEGAEPVSGDPLKPGPWQEICASSQIVVNLVGANIFSRWTPAYKRLIRETRVYATRQIVSCLGKGAVLLNASAVGFYGADRGEEEVTESSGPGNDFLARVCQEWEREALAGERRGARVCLMRFGIVLGPDGGALKKMLLPFKLGLGGPLGSGKQWFPWIHIKDLCRAAVFLAQKETLAGPFNFVAPGIVRQKEFVKALGRVLRRPAILPVPAFVLRLVFGELADLFLGGVKARPARLLEAGFRFQFPEIESALEDLLRGRRF
ncbi:MAG: TIGR01777 family protein [Thermodesulfobacteria bacterium]|nr:TIGR01777 family protein [Thermodesulfobacteriota bacterium]